MAVLATGVVGFIDIHSSRASLAVPIFLHGNGRAEGPKDYIAGIEREFGFKPETLIEDGARRFGFWRPAFCET